MKITPYTPDEVAATELSPELVAELDDDTLLLALDAASDDDRALLMTEIEQRGLNL